MKSGVSVVLVLAGLMVAVPHICAQDSQSSNAAASGQDKTAQQNSQTGTEQKQAPSSENPFPEDMNTVPVLPSANAPAAATESGSAEESGSEQSTESVRVPLADDTVDPIHSPDDPVLSVGSGEEENFSSSLKATESLLPNAESDQPDKKKKLVVKEKTHQEVASEDIQVGGYYLEKKNWKAALSRFQSALVLDPENPDVYWGLAVAEQHLGEYSAARAHYLQLLDYDPDGPHGKQARKALNDPQIANAQAASPAAPASAAPSPEPQK
jgi:tetratricopeptide (TPR) repeat protein